MSENSYSQMSEILHNLREGQLLVVNPRKRNGLILCKGFYAEFAGPGAVVGSSFDLDVERIIPVGNLSLIAPKSPKERINAYLIRRQWVRLLKQITDNPIPQQRAQVILNQFENWFDPQITAQLPDEAFAFLVGVLPQTIQQARNSDELDI
jgi:hypothetical protein